MNSHTDRYLKIIHQALEQLPLPDEPGELYAPIKYTLALKSKRMRPLLAMLASGLFEGNDKEAVKVAVAIELFHNFTLIHDDIMDNAPLRRGKPAVHKKWNSDVAILSGDALLIKSYELLASCNSGILPELLHLFNETAIYVCEGQQMDMNFESRKDVAVEEYLKMIELKTAVLVGASLKMGAITAGADSSAAQCLYDFGLNIGIAFQLKDDWLDAYANPDKLGKRIGGDILAGKKTYLVLKALELGNESQNTQLRNLLSGEGDPDDTVQQVLAIFDNYDISTLLSSEMQRYFNKGMSGLHGLEVDNGVGFELKTLAEKLMYREF